jgi:hypothetical protein
LPDLKGDIIGAAEHDIFYPAKPDVLTEKDVIYLSRCGVHWVEKFECLAIFV